MFLIARKDGTGESRTVDANDLLTACEALSDQGRYPLNVSTVAQAAPPQG